jgi:hypothetical protein
MLAGEAVTHLSMSTPADRPQLSITGLRPTIPSEPTNPPTAAFWHHTLQPPRSLTHSTHLNLPILSAFAWLRALRLPHQPFHLPHYTPPPSHPPRPAQLMSLLFHSTQTCCSYHTAASTPRVLRTSNQTPKNTTQHRNNHIFTTQVLPLSTTLPSHQLAGSILPSPSNYAVWIVSAHLLTSSPQASLWSSGPSTPLQLLQLRERARFWIVDFV